MPSSLIAEMDRVGATTTPNGLDEHRAIQLALELSMLGLNSDDDGQFGDLRSKKSMNTTECVPVPSSEHVAEIVGRQGCKIKALRAKTNTYIKTPVRGEEPVFVVTGRKEDVSAAKREIQQAADHFSQIRATRRNSASLSSLGPPSPTTPGQVTKQVRVPYRVVGLVVGPKGATIKRIQQATNTYIVTPSRDKEPVFEVTGLPDNVEKARKEIEHHIALRTGGMVDSVCNGICPPPADANSDAFATGNGFSSGLFSPSSHGTFSAFLDQNHPSASHHHHHLQQHQRSQSTDSYPYFSGSSGSSKFSDLSSASSPFSNNGFFYDGVIPSPNGDLESPPNSAFDPAPGATAPGSVWPDLTTRQNQINRVVGSLPLMPRSNSLGMIGGQEQRSPPCGSPLQYSTRSLSGSSLGDGLAPIFSTTYSSFNRSVGTTSSENSTTLASTTDAIKQSQVSIAVNISSSNGTTDESAESSPGASGGWSKPELSTVIGNVINNNNNNSMINGVMGSPTDKRKNCFFCSENEVTAALIPCGHNLFCMECANRVKEEVGECPACHQQVKQVLRIFS